MKIERVNDYQIRCTLTKDDLASRQLKISELAYGTDKAKDLFRDMMQQANYQFGFDAEDIPLMIEAVPINSECIVLIITKVEDPEELDTRFANFSPALQSEVSGSYTEEEEDGDTDIMNLFKKLRDADSAPAEGTAKRSPNQMRTAGRPAAADPFFLFSFGSMHDVMNFSAMNNAEVSVRNTLYKSDKDGKLFLLIHPDGASATTLKKLCTVLSEYGKPETSSSISEQYFNEHYQIIIKDEAIQKLAGI
ncbi:adaptor protein MecA [Butyrivibrio sp. MB2005]|uniref:adaptor protein MecA n=1 Tax=Butyrivibrio sp. MB2005 TaxID=1280678 RepID=UPI000423811B|nr:adaptor protein MecA [Butyrivibrio sp. MB2005]